MEELPSALAADLSSAFDDLVHALADDVYSGLRRLAGPDEAEDLTQETFIRAYRALEGYGPERIRELRLRGWIWTIALNLGRNHARDRARRPTLVELDPATNTASSTDPEPPDSAQWDKRLSTLSAPQRKAVVLRHVVGLDYAEIGEATGRPETTVRSDVRRGLERLRRMMEAEQ